MSTSSVRTAIEAAKTPNRAPRIDEAKMRKIVGIAEADREVFPGEAKLIAGVADEFVASPPQPSRPPRSEVQGRLTVELGAARVANAMFVRNWLPYGSNRAPLAERIEAELAKVKLPKLDAAPAKRGLHEVPLAGSKSLERTALIRSRETPSGGHDVTIYLRKRSRAGTSFSGPLQLSIPSPAEALKLELLTRFNAVRDGLSYGQPAPEGSFDRIFLYQEKHMGGSTFVALVPRSEDPDVAPASFVVERSGGSAPKSYSSPIALA